MLISQWMSWENGVDLVASTAVNGPPNVIVHVARTVHTPLGSASAGMIFFQPDPQETPNFMGFVSDNLAVGSYFGPNIFRDTPFEAAPYLPASFEWLGEGNGSIGVKVSIDGFVIESSLSQLSPLQLVSREAGSPLPFAQQGLEAKAEKASLRINDVKIEIFEPGGSMTGGPNAVWAPCGLYAR